MNGRDHRTTIIVADDDPDDRELMEDALRECRIRNHVVFVENGAKLMSYLRSSVSHDGVRAAARAGLILLDLNMPGMDGREVLRVIRNDQSLRRLIVVVLTTSRDLRDISLCYELGANAFLHKPSSYEELVRMLGRTHEYWFETAEQPTAT